MGFSIARRKHTHTLKIKKEINKHRSNRRRPNRNSTHLELTIARLVGKVGVTYERWAGLGKGLSEGAVSKERRNTRS